MRSITAAFTVAVLTAVPAAAQELTGERRSAPPPTRAKFEVLFGGVALQLRGRLRRQLFVRRRGHGLAARARRGLGQGAGRSPLVGRQVARALGAAARLGGGR